jgi:hypothetical protein
LGSEIPISASWNRTDNKRVHWRQNPRGFLGDLWQYLGFAPMILNVIPHGGKMKNSLFLLFIILMCGTSFAESCRDRKVEIRDTIKNTKCTKDSECEIAFFGCPFGCGSAVSLVDAPKIKERVSKLLSDCAEERCGYKQCVPPDAVKCVKNVCTSDCGKVPCSIM